jgi:tetratricopeptide (TPR) repeat protein
MKKFIRPAFLIPVVLFILILVSLIFVIANQNVQTDIITPQTNFNTQTPMSQAPSKFPLQKPPSQKILPTTYHIFQSFNNCGPAALSMALRFYGIEKSQEELGQVLRPYQNAVGDNDDKSVTLEELAKESEKYGFVPYHRPNGDIEKIKLFITYDMPVITRTWLKPDEDIGHYRVIKGYNAETGQLIQDDSLQNKNLWYTYDDFNVIWGKFNYEYLVLVPKDKTHIVDAILEDETDPKVAWQKAVERSGKILSENPNDVTARFNLSVAYFNTGQYQKSVEEFEKVENQLPFRTLWYQIEPIQAYYELGNYDRVFALTDAILNYQNRAYEQAYLVRGKSYQKQEQNDLARQEFEKAVFYNPNWQEAKEALVVLN